jgi:hypothetical protein
LPFFEGTAQNNIEKIDHLGNDKRLSTDFGFPGDETGSRQLPGAAPMFNAVASFTQPYD